MSGFGTPLPSNNPNAPRDIRLDTLILALPGLVGWFSGDARYCLQVDGVVTSLLNRVPGGAAFTQATAGKQGVIVPNAYNRMSALRFDGSNDCYTYAGTFDTDAAYTWGAIARPDSTASSDEGILSKFVDANNLSILSVSSTDGYRYVQGNGSLILQAAGSVSLTEPVLLIGGTNSTNEIDGEFNGVAKTAVFTNDANGTGALTLGGLSDGGGLWDGDIFEIFMFDRYLFSGAENQQALKCMRRQMYMFGAGFELPDSEPDVE